MPHPTKKRSHAVQEKKHKDGKATAVVKPTVIVIGNDGQISDSSDDDVGTSPSRQPLSSSTISLTTKRKRSTGPKRQSTAWHFYSNDKTTGVTTCTACPYEVTPTGHTGNAVSHLRNNHQDLFEDYQNQEERRKEILKKPKQKLFIQPTIKFVSSDPYPPENPRYSYFL